MHYIRGFDGLRALSIALVMGLHLAQSGWFPNFPENCGRLGVAVFFALSGYLITRLLLASRQSLMTFYFRRSLRIFPAYIVYLLTLLALQAMGYLHLDRWGLFAAATYWMNWYRGWRDPTLQHTWSLAVEEQFYLLWPPLLFLLGPRRAAFGLLLGLALWPLQRWFRHGRFGHLDLNDALFSVTYDVILWGCLGALYQQLVGRRLPRWSWLPAVVVVCTMYAGGANFLPAVLAPPLRNACISWLVVWIAQHQQHPLTNLLEWAPLRYLGKRSYSLYLWHLLLLDVAFQKWFSPIFWLVGSFALAEMSYRAVERPCLTWRDRRRPVLEPGLKHQDAPESSTPVSSPG